MVTPAVAQGQVLWTPTPEARERSELARYLAWLRRERNLSFGDYAALFHWSIADLDGFWSSLWDYFGIRAHTPYERVLGARELPGAEWFPGARLNYAEHMLGRPEDAVAVAVVAYSQTRDPFELTFGELHLPRFDPPAGRSLENHLRDLVYEGAAVRYGMVTPEIRDRIEYELGVIVPMGFAG